MGYFPFFVDIEGRNILVIGAGQVALRKVEKLLQFSPDITVVAPLVCDELVESGVKIIQREFADSDLDGAFAVISATDDEELNAHIYKLCSERNILVNIVDDKEKCGFIFPALVHENDITIGISTSGKSPLFARFLREMTEDMLLGNCYPDISEILGRYRQVIKNGFNTEVKRREASEALLELCMIDDKLPSDDEIQSMLEEMKKRL